MAKDDDRSMCTCPSLQILKCPGQEPTVNVIESLRETGYLYMPPE